MWNWNQAAIVAHLEQEPLVKLVCEEVIFLYLVSHTRCFSLRDSGISGPSLPNDRIAGTWPAPLDTL